ncbi:MAG: hypothetical protein ACSW8D_08050 [Prevotella sp.]
MTMANDYEPITKELRERMVRLLMSDQTKGELTDLCDNIDAIHRSLEQENERLRDASKRGDDWIKLPVDADGVPIHIGDRMENNERVARIVLTDDSWEPSVYLEKLPNVLHECFCNEISHYHPDTWESIIEDAREYRLNIGGSYLWKNKSDELVSRCKALCERTREVEE